MVDAARRPPESLTEGAYQVAQVIDVRTLLLTNQARVRLIGTASPWSAEPTSTAADAVWEQAGTEWAKRLAAGREVRLQFDHERVNRDGCFLAYVWIGDRLLNEELIRAGLARSDARPRCLRTFKDRFRRAQQQAKADRRGMWSAGSR